VRWIISQGEIEYLCAGLTWGINRHFTSWPGLTEHAVEKYLSKSTSTTNGHLNKQRQNARSTKVKYPKVSMAEPDLDQGIKTQYVYAATIDAGQICTDHTGIFPVVPSKGLEVYHDLIWLWQQCHLGTTHQRQNCPGIIESFSGYGTRIGSFWTRTKTYETGQWGVKRIENVPTSAKHHISIGPYIQP
jgi:hypothetical protein